MRKLIELEITDSVEVCGNYVPKVKTNDKPNVTATRNDKNARSFDNRNSPKGSPKGSTENLHVDKNSRSTTPSCDNENVDNKTTEVEIIDNEVNINEPKSVIHMSEKELSLKIIVELPDDENKKEELSPKEREFKEQLEPKEEKVKEADDLYEKEEDTAECDKPDNETSYQNNVVNDILEQEEAKICKDLDLILQLGESVKNDTKESVRHKQQNLIKRKAKDRLNEERRAESPRDIVERHNRGNSDNDARFRGRERSATGRRKDERAVRNNRSSSKYEEESERSLDFDSMYRLPTEHLLHSRFRRGDAARPSRVENQLKIYEQLNSRLKLAERDKCIGAMGGVNVDTHEDGISLPQEDVEPRSRSSSGSSGTEAGNLGDLVPRRFER